MKSYSKHLDSIKKSTKNAQGVFRSSAIFPIIVNENLDSQISFLSYWFLKRKIKYIEFRLSLRNEVGKKIFYSKSKISFTKVFNFSIKEILNKKKISYKKKNFYGSIELEFFSKINMVFPFPATMINLRSLNSSTFVHTCGRIFNNLKDKKDNTKLLVPESGFDLLPDKNLRPFFSFVNSNNTLKKVYIRVEIINIDGERLFKKFLINSLKPFETKFIFFLTNKEKTFLKNKKGSIKIYHNFTNFYPRFMAGNFHNQYKYSTLTHTYYDLSNVKDYKNNIWKNPNQNKYFDSSVAVPIYLKRHKTELVVYPNILKKNFYLKIGFFLKKKMILLYNRKIENLKKPLYIDLSSRCLSLNKDLKKRVILGKIICTNSGIIPSRIKFGLNIYSENKLNIPSNICFNVFVPTLNVENKPGIFKWGFANPEKNFEIIVINNSFLKKDNKVANIKIKYWNDKKNIFKVQSIKVKDHEVKTIKPNDTIFKRRIFSKNNYWFTIESDNPFLSGYFVNFNKNGLVGAEHFF